MPFAHDLVVAVRPSLFVELGTHLGESYFGFCQAITENGVPCRAYAIDTWKGEAHAGFYDETVYEEVHPYNESNYQHFSYLIRSLFDDALRNFADDSIDILHIDGLHTFEAVSHDFHAWLPKVRPGGIVLLHDVAVRHQDFGVWRLWDALKTQGKTFEFNHGWGLGVFRKPDGPEPASDLLHAMFEGDERTREQIRRFYSLLALELKHKHALDPRHEDPRLQVYLPSPDGYQEAHSQTVIVQPNRWQRVSMDLFEGIAAGPLRLDLADRPAIIEVRGIVLRSAVDEAVIWSAAGPDFDLLTPGGTLIRVKFKEKNGENNEACRFFSFGDDPQLYLPPLDPTKFDQPLTLQIWMRLQTTLESLVPMLVEDERVPQPSIDRHSQEVEDLKSQLHALQSERDLERQMLTQEVGKETDAMAIQLQAAADQLAANRLERENLAAELQAAADQLAANRLEREKLIQEVNRKQTKIYLLEDFQEAETRIEELEKKCTNLDKAYAELQNSNRALQEERERLQATIANVLVSHSWRLTAPLRKVVGSFRTRNSHTVGT